MILSFSTKWPKGMEGYAGEPTYFIEKIWEGLLRAGVSDTIYHEYMDKYTDKFGEVWDWMPDEAPRLSFGKLTTIREGERWKRGTRVHPYINNRSKNAFQFAPTLEACKVQDIFMAYAYNDLIQISVNGRELFGYPQREELALKDGFESWQQFFEFFYPKIMAHPEKEFKGQLITWKPIIEIAQ